MADLATKKRDGFLGSDGEAHDRAGGAIDPTRHIDRDNLGRPRVNCLDYGVCCALDRAIEARPKQGINDHVACRQR